MTKKIYKYRRLLCRNSVERWDSGLGRGLGRGRGRGLGLGRDLGRDLGRGLGLGLTFYQIYLKVKIKVLFLEVQMVMQSETTRVVIIQALYVMAKI